MCQRPSAYVKQVPRLMKYTAMYSYHPSTLMGIVSIGKSGCCALSAYAFMPWNRERCK